MPKQFTLTLGEEAHVLHTPNMYVARLTRMYDPSVDIQEKEAFSQEEYAKRGLAFEDIVFVILAACLTREEEWKNGQPAKIWSPDEVANMTTHEQYGEAAEVAMRLLYDFWGLDYDEVMAAVEEAEKAEAEAKGKPKRKKAATRPNPE